MIKMETYVDVKPAEVLAKLFLLLWPDVLEVLVSENYYAALRYQQRELVFLGIGQL